MAFRGEVDYGARPMLAQQLGHQGAVADVALHEHMALITLQAGKVVHIARIGQFVEVDDRLVVHGQPVEYEIGTDKACAACDQNHGWCI